MMATLVNVSAITLHLLHGAVMDGRAPGAWVPPSCEGIWAVCWSIGLVCITILDVVVPRACRDFHSSSQGDLSKDHSWKRNPLGP